jgi:carbon storage regulator CsrA
MALVLTQRLNDGPIHIEIGGEHVEINLLGINKGQARYGFTAADNVIINRDIVYKRIQREQNND